MAENSDTIGRMKDAARRAQEEANRLRREAERLRGQADEEGSRAREAAQILRDEAREAARIARDEANRLRHEARDLERRLRQESREGRRRGSNAAPEPNVEQQTLDFAGIHRLDVEQTAGNLSIRTVSGDEAPSLQTSSSRGTPKIDVQRVGDELRVRIELSSGWIFRRKQGINTTLTIPAALQDLRTSLGYGDLDLREVAVSSMRLNVGAGKITGLATSGELLADVGAGRINLNVHRGLATCHTGTGDVSLDIAETAPGDYKIDVGIGRIEVRFPAEAAVHVTTSTGMGKTTKLFRGAPAGAPSRLRANTGIGELIVKARSEADEMAEPPPPSRPRGNRPPAARRHEVEELRILQMLEQGRISSQDAAELIAALQGAAPIPPESYAGGEASAPASQDEWRSPGTTS